MLIDIIEIHSDIVSSYTVQKFKIVDPSYHLACSILLVDGSRLFVKDYLFLDGQIKYSFHWQDKEGICIIRWDNAPHHQDVNMIHIEVQSDKDRDFPLRMYVYNYRIFDKQYLPVTSLAILADDNPSWRPVAYSSEQWGCEIQCKFPVVKLFDYSDKIDSLLEKTNPFAIITAAHLKTKTTKNNPQQRYAWKWTITRALYEKGFSTKDILSLYRLVDWLMILPDDLTKQFTQNLIAYEEEKKMPYITSAERIGIEKGKLEGRNEGRDEGMLFNAREMVLECQPVQKRAVNFVQQTRVLDKHS
jgi:hypothetical protein